MEMPVAHTSCFCFRLEETPHGYYVRVDLLPANILVALSQVACFVPIVDHVWFKYLY